MCDQVWPIWGSLAWVECFFYLRPVSISSESDQGITGAQLPCYGQGFLHIGPHVPGAALKGGWKNDPLPYLFGITGIIGKGIHNPSVQLCPEFLLIGFGPV